MSDVRTFRAPSMQAALDVVRREMGADAVILHTRQISQRRWLPWGKALEEVEITAGLGVNIPPLAARRRPRPVPTPRRAEGQPVQARNRAVEEPAAYEPAAPAFRSVADTGRALGGGSAFERTSADGDTFVLSPRSLTAAAAPESRIPARHFEPKPSDQSTDLAIRLDSIQRMLERLGNSRPPAGQGEIPGELFHLYTELIDNEVEDELARDLIFGLRTRCSSTQLADRDAAKASLTAMVESQIRASGPIRTIPGKRKVVALVGATGVGKTTTIAKLAANFRLRDGIKMGLITVDTYRIAAVEQLRTYAEIIDLPMKVVTNPSEMRRAIDELIGLDLVLVDTAGRSPRDELQIHELKTLLAESTVDEVHLVLSMSSSVKSLISTAEKFAAAPATSLILTKLDEAAGMGGLLSLSRNVSLPISYITTGQDVPDDIESATAARLARLVLGQERLNA